jgi:hypothetical protein
MAMISTKFSILQNENETSSIAKIYFLMKVLIDVVVYFEY